MGNVLKVKDKKTNKWIDIPAIQGRSAYEIAVDGGFEGTEEEFAEALTGVALDGEHITNTNNPHKVTAKQVGALPITGGTMSGDIIIDKPNTKGTVKFAHNYHNRATISTVQDGTNGQGHRSLMIHNADHLGGLSNALQLYDKPADSATGVIYTIYGTHNKPTAADVGAIAETIGIDGKDILDIVDDGWYFSINSKNVPTVSTFGYVLVRTSTDINNYRVVYWRPADLTTEYVNMLIDGKWSGWTETFTNKGGTLSNNLTVAKNQYPDIICRNTNDGTEGLFRQDSGLTAIISRNADKTKYRTLQIYNPDVRGKENALRFSTVEDGSVTGSYNIFGEHNKLTGSYTGTFNTSDATGMRTVEIGGIGNALLVWVSDHFMIVGPTGAMSITSNTMNPHRAYFKDGKLTFNKDGVFNNNGITYNFQVL
jgi:hypothetical protein